MSLLPVITAPNPVLKQSCLPVETFDDQLRSLVNDMFKIMVDNEGIGLAAPQIGILQQVVVIGYDGTELVIINPSLSFSGAKVAGDEACLSLPGLTCSVERYPQLILNAFDQYGNPYTRECSDFFARIVQHEVDHLNGILITDIGEVVPS